jgi:hypothetical protein
LVWFWFSKMNTFFKEEDAISNIDYIYNNVIKSKIKSTYYKSETIVYFNKKLSWFYSIYENNYDKSYYLYWYSWSLVNNNLKLNLYSKNYLSSSWTIGLEKDWDFLENKQLNFSASWVTEYIELDEQELEKKDILLKNSSNYILSWKLKLYPNSYDNSLSLLNIVWKDMNWNEISLDSVEIINSKDWINSKYGYKNNVKYKITKLTLWFIDRYNNWWYIEF